MSVKEIYENNNKTCFSIELLPPLKGNSIAKVFNVVEKLKEFDPKFINITSHHSESIFVEQPDGSHRKVTVRKRPGTVAIAAAIQNKFGIPAVPHVICKGFTKEETEYALLDLNFLGVFNLFLLRGDSKSVDTRNQDPSLYNEHATDLQEQVNNFNKGIALDGSRIEGIDTPFSYGMACYPEKHEEAPNMESDIYYLKKKVENGAQYVVTQMFFDNQKYFDFVDRCRAEGITVPIIPGIKPFGKLSQLSVVPKTFKIDLPQPLASEALKCTTDEQARELGKEWCIQQCKELMAAGVPSIHFYTVGAVDSVRAVAEAIY
jgi:methylenetetrahydrofolate reductase (NADPH)